MRMPGDIAQRRAENARDKALCAKDRFDAHDSGRDRQKDVVAYFQAAKLLLKYDVGEAFDHLMYLRAMSAGNKLAFSMTKAMLKNVDKLDPKKAGVVLFEIGCLYAEVTPDPYTGSKRLSASFKKSWFKHLARQAESNPLTAASFAETSMTDMFPLSEETGFAALRYAAMCFGSHNMEANAKRIRDNVTLKLMSSLRCA